MDLNAVVGPIVAILAITCIGLAIFIELRAKKDQISFAQEFAKLRDALHSHATALETHAEAIKQSVDPNPAAASVSAAPTSSGQGAGASLASRIRAAGPEIAAVIDRAVAKADAPAPPAARDPFAIGKDVVDWLSANHGPVTYDHGRVIRWLVEHPTASGKPEAPELEAAYEATIVQGKDQSAADKAIAEANAARAQVQGNGVFGVATLWDGGAPNANGYFLWQCASRYQQITGRSIWADMVYGANANAFIDAHEVGAFDKDVGGALPALVTAVTLRMNGG